MANVIKVGIIGAGRIGLKPVLIGLAAKRSLAEHRPVRVAEIEG